MTQPHLTSVQRARQLLVHLQLQPHPEGGWYREVFRSDAQVQPADGRPARPALTSIYFLLEAGQHSRWHKVLSDEVWVYLEGAPLDLWAWDAATQQASCTQLGPVSSAEDMAGPLSRQPQHVIAAGLWQAARPQPGHPDGFTLVACMVGPGFDFSDFQMMLPDGYEARLIKRDHPHLSIFNEDTVSRSAPTHARTIDD